MKRSLTVHPPRRPFSLVLLALLFLPMARAQVNSVDIDLAPAANPEHLEVRLRFNGDGFGEVFSGFVFTIRWVESSPALLPLGTPFCTGAAFPIGASAHVVNDGFRYRTWNMEGMAQLQADPDLDGGCGFSFPEGEWVTILTLAPIGNTECTEFQIVNDAFTTANNRNFYLSLNGQQNNGQGQPLAALIEPTPVLAGACGTDCAGVPGGEAYLDNCGDCVGGTTGEEPCAQDCTGEFGGAALPGSSCDDNDPCTQNGIWSVECQCIGEPVFNVIDVSGPDTVLVGETITYTVDAVDGAAYAWDLPDGWATQDPGSSVVVVSAGGAAHVPVEVCVTLTIAGCEEQVCTTVWVDGGLAIGAHASETPWLSIFPNPSSGMFRVEWPTDTGDPIELSLHDVLGRRVVAPARPAGSQPHVLDLSGQANGTYLLRVVVQGEVRSARLVLQR